MKEPKPVSEKCVCGREKDEHYSNSTCTYFVPASSPAGEWEKEFVNKIGHDDWCKTLKYPQSSWDCNCYMKDSLLLIKQIESDAFARGREEGAFEEGERRTKIWNKIIPESNAEALSTFKARVVKEIEKIKTIGGAVPELALKTELINLIKRL